jgi:hypothetical protein
MGQRWYQSSSIPLGKGMLVIGCCTQSQKGQWCDAVLNIHAKTEDERNEELERIFDKFPKYHTKILLGDFSAKVGREDIFKPTIRNESDKLCPI